MPTPIQYGDMIAKYDGLLFPSVETDTGMVLRPYQQEACYNIHIELSEKNSTLDLSATGTGKSVVQAQIGADYAQFGQVVFLVRKINLAHQLASEIRNVTGHWPLVEQGENNIDVSKLAKAKFVVCTVQTLTQEGRLNKFWPDRVSMIAIDEVHQAINESTLKVIDHFKQNSQCKVVGYTATADRADGRSISKVCESVAHIYDTRRAIREGYLVPIKPRGEYITSLDLSTVDITGDDLNGKQLEEAFSREKVSYAIAKMTHEICGQEKTIVFCSGVTAAEILRGHLNAIQEGYAKCIFGHTPKEERKIVLEGHRNGDYPVLVNCEVLTEGYNDRSVKFIVLATKTNSRSRYAQMAGRGMRTLEGVIDHLSHESPEVRRAAIAASDKPQLTLIDVYGSASKHSLITPVKVLAGDDFSPAAIELVEERLEKEDLDIEEALEEAEEEVKANYQREQSELAELISKNKIDIKVGSTTVEIDPFFIWPLPTANTSLEVLRGRLATKEQRQYLKKYNIKSDHLTYSQAVAACDRLDKERTKPTTKQLEQMRLANVPNFNRLTRDEAKHVFVKRMKNDWAKWPRLKGLIRKDIAEKLERETL